MALVDDKTYPKQQHQIRFEGQAIPPSPRRPDSRPQKSITLPYELYEKILEYAIDELVHPYKRCNWLTSPSYYFKMGPFSRYGRNEIAHWKNYRLVCRTFARILYYPIQKTLNSTHSYIPEGVRILQIGQTSNSIPFISRIVSSFPACQSVTSLAFCGSSLEIRIEETISLLLDGSKALPNLRSLSLGSRLPRDFWERLAKSFPLLIELYIDGRVQCDTHVTLENLEILYAISIEARCLLYCPNLKHLFVYTCSGWETFLQSHSTRLESLLTQTGTTPFHYLEIRSQFPCLRTYSGVISSDLCYTTKSFDLQSVPPPDQWCLFTTYHDAIRSRNLINTVSEVTGIHFLTLWAQMVTRQEAKTLEEMCQKRNGHVTWIDPMKYAPDSPYSVLLFRYSRHYCPNWLKNAIILPCKAIVFLLLCIIGILVKCGVMSTPWLP
jgi:hypothetical protein